MLSKTVYWVIVTLMVATSWGLKNDQRKTISCTFETPLLKMEITNTVKFDPDYDFA